MNHSPDVELNELYVNSSRSRAIKGTIHLVLMLGLSSLLYFLGVARILFLTPIMIYSINRKRGSEILASALEFVLISAVEAVGIFTDSSVPDVIRIPLYIVNLAIPLTLLVSGVIWINSSREKLVEARVTYAMLPLLTLCVAFCIWAVFDRALLAEVYTYYENVFAEMLSPVLGVFEGLEFSSGMFYLIVLSLASLILPGYLLAVCVSSHVYECVKHSKENSWEEKVASFDLHPNMIWGFLIPWAVVLLSYFISVPVYASVIILNLAFSATILYVGQGFIVLFCRLRKRFPNLKSLTLLAITFIVLTVAPGVNIVCLLCLLILGLLENFFDMKKIGVKNEDYS